MPAPVRVRLVVLATEPSDSLPGDPVSESVTTVFTRRNLFAVGVPREGERIEARSLGKHVAKYFPQTPVVAGIEHRLADMFNEEPTVYVLIRLDTPFVDEAMIADFEADGYRVRRRPGPGELARL